MDYLVKIENVDIGYTRDQIILGNVNLNIAQKDFIIIKGFNGSGKSTLLKILYMALLPSKGKVSIFNCLIEKHKRKEITEIRKKLGVILQNNYLIPYLSVRQNIALATLIQNSGKAIFDDRVEEIISWAGLKNISDEKVLKLSEGEKQKVIIARALVSKPKLLIADEPMIHLDEKSKEKFFFLLSSINKLGTTIVMTTKVFEKDQIAGVTFFSTSEKKLKKL